MHHNLPKISFIQIVTCFGLIVVVQIFSFWLLDVPVPKVPFVYYKEAFVCMGIISHLAAFKERAMVRDTWLQYAQGRDDVTYSFIVGKLPCQLDGSVVCTPEEESLLNELLFETATHRDVLQVHVSDDYSKLSQKTFHMFQWAAEIPHSYFIKADHDVFVRLDVLLNEFKLNPTPNKLLWGYIYRSMTPIRDPLDRNAEFEYDLSEFPPYPAGPMYILSKDLVGHISRIESPRFIFNEDQALGLWLHNIQFDPVHDRRIQHWKVCRDDMIMRHSNNPEELVQLYLNIQGGRDLCDGFDTSICPVCYTNCLDEKPGWKQWFSCDMKKGVFPTEAARAERALLDFVDYGSVCQQNSIQDNGLYGNLVNNGHFELTTDTSELMRTKPEAMWVYPATAKLIPGGLADVSHSIDYCLQLESSPKEENRATQIVQLNQKQAKPIVIWGWSKSKDIKQTRAFPPYFYSIWAEVKMEGIVWTEAVTVNFGVDDSGEWHWRYRIFYPTHPIKYITLHLTFRGHEDGVVWFDNILVSDVNSVLCELRHMRRNFDPAVVRLYPNPISLMLSQPTLPNDGHPSEQSNFFFIWSTSPTKWGVRHRRTIESVFVLYPTTHVLVYSNTLPLFFFHKFIIAGYRVSVVRYNITTLGKDLPGYTWVQNIKTHQKSPSFYAHLADYLRFLLLYHFGGVYSDTDSLLLNKMPSGNTIALEYCDNDALTYCFDIEDIPQLEQYRGLKRTPTTKFYVPIGLLSLTKGHPLMIHALSYFDTSYDGSIWPCGTKYLSDAYTKLVSGGYVSVDPSSLTVLPPSQFYPVSWQNMHTYFRQNANATQLWLEKIEPTSIAMHLWNKMSIDWPIEGGSVMEAALTKTSISVPKKCDSNHFSNLCTSCSECVPEHTLRCDDSYYGEGCVCEWGFEGVFCQNKLELGPNLFTNPSTNAEPPPNLFQGSRHKFIVSHPAVTGPVKMLVLQRNPDDKDRAQVSQRVEVGGKRNLLVYGCSRFVSDKTDTKPNSAYSLYTDIFFEDGTVGWPTYRGFSVRSQQDCVMYRIETAKPISHVYVYYLLDYPGTAYFHTTRVSEILPSKGQSNNKSS